MCGIIGVVRRPATRAVPEPEEILDPLGVAASALAELPADSNNLFKNLNFIFQMSQ